MHEHQTANRRGNGSPNLKALLDTPPDSIHEAAKKDILIASKKHGTAVLEELGQAFGIGPWAVYKRAERTGYQFDADDLEDVYRITGGYATEALIHHWRVLRRLSGNVTDQQIADDIGGNLQRATSMIQMILQDLSADDDTPGVFDREELHRLEAALAEAAAQIESAQADVQGRLRIIQNKEASRS